MDEGMITQKFCEILSVIMLTQLRTHVVALLWKCTVVRSKVPLTCLSGSPAENF